MSTGGLIEWIDIFPLGWFESGQSIGLHNFLSVNPERFDSFATAHLRFGRQMKDICLFGIQGTWLGLTPTSFFSPFESSGCPGSLGGGTGWDVA